MHLDEALDHVLNLFPLSISESVDPVKLVVRRKVSLQDSEQRLRGALWIEGGGVVGEGQAVVSAVCPNIAGNRDIVRIGGSPRFDVAVGVERRGADDFEANSLRLAEAAPQELPDEHDAGGWTAVGGVVRDDHRYGNLEAVADRDQVLRPAIERRVSCLFGACKRMRDRQSKGNVCVHPRRSDPSALLERYRGVPIPKDAFAIIVRVVVDVDVLSADVS